MLGSHFISVSQRHAAERLSSSFAVLSFHVLLFHFLDRHGNGYPAAPTNKPVPFGIEVQRHSLECGAKYVCYDIEVALFG